MRFRKIYIISPLSAPYSWKTPGTTWSFLLPIMANLALGPWLCENSDWVQKKELTLLMKVLPIHPWAIYPWDPRQRSGTGKGAGGRSRGRRVEHKNRNKEAWHVWKWAAWLCWLEGVSGRRDWESSALGNVFFLSVLSLHFVFSYVF